MKSAIQDRQPRPTGERRRLTSRRHPIPGHKTSLSPRIISAGFHLVHLVIDAGGAFALFRALRSFGRLLGAEQPIHPLLAMLAAALWCLHPMRGESADGISRQLYLGASLFTVAALLCCCSLCTNDGFPYLLQVRERARKLYQDLSRQTQAVPFNG